MSVCSVYTQVCWMLSSVRLKADAIAKSPDCMEKHGEMWFSWKGEGIKEKKWFLEFEGKLIIMKLPA